MLASPIFPKQVRPKNGAPRLPAAKTTHFCVVRFGLGDLPFLLPWSNCPLSLRVDRAARLPCSGAAAVPLPAFPHTQCEPTFLYSSASLHRLCQTRAVSAAIPSVPEIGHPVGHSLARAGLAKPQNMDSIWRHRCCCSRKVQQLLHIFHVRLDRIRPRPRPYFQMNSAAVCCLAPALLISQNSTPFVRRLSALPHHVLRLKSEHASKRPAWQKNMRALFSSLHKKGKI